MLTIGDSASLIVRITDESVALFVRLSGDSNAIHVDEKFAQTTRFGRRIAPGIQIASYISAVLANELPGPGTIYLEQTLKFEAPVYLGDDITTKVTVLDFPQEGRTRLETTCTNQTGIRVLSGIATVMLPLENGSFRRKTDAV